MNIPKLRLNGDTTPVSPPDKPNKLDKSNKISDERFIDQLKEVQDLKRFLFEE
jgi:hypothetical protein